MQKHQRFDILAFGLMLAAAALGLVWANYNRTLAAELSGDPALRPHVWSIFALPFGLFIGWLIARRHEGWLALFVCFCLYFFSTFIAARYESCAVVTGSFDLGICFTGTAAAQDAAATTNHALYFQAILVVQSLAALGIALQRAFSRSTMPNQLPPQPSAELKTQQSD